MINFFYELPLYRLISSTQFLLRLDFTIRITYHCLVCIALYTVVKVVVLKNYLIIQVLHTNLRGQRSMAMVTMLELSSMHGFNTACKQEEDKQN